MTDDEMAERVYAAEAIARRGTARTVAAADVERLSRRWLDEAGHRDTTAPKFRWDLAGGGGADLAASLDPDGVIHLRAPVAADVLVHESAHHAGPAAAHGHAFVGSLLTLTEAALGRSAATRLRRALVAEGAEVGAPSSAARRARGAVAAASAARRALAAQAVASKLASDQRAARRAEARRHWALVAASAGRGDVSRWPPSAEIVQAAERLIASGRTPMLTGAGDVRPGRPLRRRL